MAYDYDNGEQKGHSCEWISEELSLNRNFSTGKLDALQKALDAIIDKRPCST